LGSVIFVLVCLCRKIRSAVDGDMDLVCGDKHEKDGQKIYRGEMDGTPMTQLETPMNDLMISPLHIVSSEAEDKTQDMLRAKVESI